MVFAGLRTAIRVCAVGVVAAALWPMSAAAAELTILYKFRGTTDGAHPGAIIFGPDSALYGTAQQGNSDQCTLGCGTVYKLTPVPGQARWRRKLLHVFQGGRRDGAEPSGALSFDDAGALYGTTIYGGDLTGCPTVGCGTVYRLTPPKREGARWRPTILHFFRGPDSPRQPYRGVILGQDSVLYGTTAFGGPEDGNCSNGCGTVFKLTPPAAGRVRWPMKVLHEFKGRPRDGTYPLSGLWLSRGGALYGTTQGGWGTVFRLAPPHANQKRWRLAILYNFGPKGDGRNPAAGLIALKGAFYGTTISGGAGNRGTIFKLTPPSSGGTAWSETLIHSFSGPDGGTPFEELIADQSGALYGTTAHGGVGNCNSGCGTVFKLTPPAPGEIAWTHVALHKFAGGLGGSGPGMLALGADGAIYGVTSNGGADLNCVGGCGMVFKLTP